MKLKGYFLGIFGSACYGLNPFFTLSLYKDGMDYNSVLFFRYLLSLPFVIIMLLANKQNLKVPLKSLPVLAFFGLMVGLSSLALFAAYNYMSSGIASTILFVYPILVAIMMMIFFGEKASAKLFFCLILSLVGIGLLCKTSSGDSISWIGFWLSILSALTYAIYLIGLNIESVKNISSLKISFYVLFFGSLLFFFSTGCLKNIILPSDNWLWLNIAGLAIFPTTVSFVCMTKAISYIGSTPTSILGAFEPLTAVLIGIFVFQEDFSLRIAIGIFLIILAVSLVVIKKNNK